VQRYQDGEGRLWRDIIDFKYDVSPNIFCCNTRNSSPFWKGVAWAALLNWVSNGMWEMVKISGSRRMCGLGLAPWPPNTGTYTLLLMSKERLLVKPEME
jgi:hypothetical protein